MQSSAFFAILLFQLGLCDLLKERAGCNADNCLRKITGTANATPNLSSRLADCSSFVQVIVEPTPITETVTSTIYPAVKRDLGDEAPGFLEARQATTTTAASRGVPPYASPCSGTVRYSSACSCAGVTPFTSTAPAPTVTVTTTVCSNTICNGTCTHTYYDEANCGACGNVCPAGSQCRGKCLFPKDFECPNFELDTSNGTTTGAYQQCRPLGRFCICVPNPGSSLGGTCISRRTPPNYCSRYPKCVGGTNAECPSDSFCLTFKPCPIPICVESVRWCEDMTDPDLG